MLGQCHEFGLGMTVNASTAVRYYREAATKGNSDAAAALARLGFMIL